MAMDKTNPDVLYAGTGEGFFNTGIPGSSNNAFRQGAGIFKTFDGGATWDQLPATNNEDFYYVNRIAISPTNHNILLVATNNGIFRSVDGGGTFNLVSAGKTYDVDFHPTDGQKAVAGRSDGKPQFSSNGGLTWTNATGTAGARVEITYARNSPNIVYAAISSNGRIKIYQSTNDGQSYALKTSGNGVSTYANYNNALWVDPTLPSRLLLGGVYLFRSTDSGVNFSEVFDNVHPDHHVLVESPQYNGSTNRVLFFGNDGGIYKTNDVTGNSSTDLNHNLGVTQFYGAGMNANGRLVAGAQDNGSQLFTGDTQGWDHVLGGDGISCAADLTDPNYFYASSQHAAIARSNDGGFGYNGIGPPGAGSSDYNFATYYMLDPNNQARMYVCGARIYRANNVKTGSPNWTMVKDEIGDGDSNEPPTDHFDAVPPKNSSTIAVAQGNSDIVWVGYNNGQIWKTTDGTATTPTWTRVDETTPNLPNRFVSRIVIDSHNTNRVYVSFMGWTDDNVWLTTDAGNTWQNISGTGAHSLPTAPVGAFAIHPIHPGWLYAGTDIGIFTSMDDGTTWTTFTDGPGTVPLAELLWHGADQLVAVTHGRGVFVADIDETGQPVAPRAFTMLRGRAISGDLDDVERSDDRYLTMRPGAVFSTNIPPIEVQFDATAPISTANGMSFSIESKGSANTISQIVSMFNFQNSTYEQVDARNLTTSDNRISIAVTGNPSRFIQAGTRAMRAKVSYKLTGAVFQYPWEPRIDTLSWELVQ
jgi:hypothetical protein